MLISHPIILAGGYGKRLRSVVKDIPKVMADINGKPFLEFILDQLNFLSLFRFNISRKCLKLFCNLFHPLTHFISSPISSPDILKLRATVWISLIQWIRENPDYIYNLSLYNASWHPKITEREVLNVNAFDWLWILLNGLLDRDKDNCPLDCPL